MEHDTQVKSTWGPGAQGSRRWRLASETLLTVTYTRGTAALC